MKKYVKASKVKSVDVIRAKIHSSNGSGQKQQKNVSIKVVVVQSSTAVNSITRRHIRNPVISEKVNTKQAL